MEVDSKEEERLSNPPPNLPAPAISVIIPMYNAEEYISECLESILEQTFQSFEVIVVDDCSTDLSCEVVERYIPKFNNRLRLYHTEKNSAGCAVPRNVGLPFSTGEYIFFMDSDDILTKTGLEEMYSLAKEYDADVVYCERYYMSNGLGEDFLKNVHVATTGKVQAPPYIEKPTLETENLSERTQKILDRRYWPSCWLKLVRHDLLDKHRIVFSAVKPSEDDIWTFCLLFFAKKWLRVPNMVYIRRMRKDSIMGSEKTPYETIKFWLSPFLFGLRDLDNFMSRHEFFQKNPQQHYALLEFFFQGKLLSSLGYLRQLSSFDVYETIKNEFSKNLGDYDVLTSALCTHIFNREKVLAKTKRELEHTKKFTRPAVSIIVSMYNSEQYIGECLDSLLAQTMQDFEVIVVDDCSTDNSVTVVNSYMSKFNRQCLRLAKTSKNTGRPGEPRNIGIGLSRGEYLLILDSDDTITPDAVENMYSVAKKFNADVVTCEKFYWVPEEHWDDAEFRKQLKPHSYQLGGFVDEPTLITSDINERIRDCRKRRFLWELWDKLVRRDFMIEHRLRSQTIMGQDALVVYCLIFTAKTFVRVPYVINFHRDRKGSLYNSHNKESDSLKKLKAYFRTLNIAFNYLSDFLGNHEFFQKNFQVKNFALETYFRHIWNIYIKKAYGEVTAHDLKEVLLEEFGNANFMQFFFDNWIHSPEEKGSQKDYSKVIRKFQNYLTARIDVKLRSMAGDFQILSLSDENASVSKPAWFQKGGVGYSIQSYTGNLNFIAKASVDGKVLLDLRSIDVRDPDDKSKCIPYWIDYTKLIVNGKTVFDTVTPAWHDKSFNYNLDVKADEEIVVEVEWLPHRSDTNVTEASVREKISDIERLNAEIENLSTKTAELQRNNAELAQTIDNFAPCFTARFDVQLTLKESAKRKDFQITSVSDSTAKVTEAGWLPKNKVGYSINSHVGKIEFVAKASSDGLFRLELRGMDVRAPEDRSKRIPYWIDYTSLTINGETMLDKVTPVWHNKPCVYSLNMKADEEVVVQAEWAPHRNDTIASEALVREKVADIEKLSTEIENLTRKTTELQRDNADLTQTVENLSTKTTELQMTNANLAQIISNFAPYLTARIDVRLISEAEGCDLKVLSVSDDKARVSKPIRYRKDGSGCSITSYVGNLKMVVKSNADGQVQVTLRGKDVRKEDDRSKRIPYWIDYTALIVNEQTILDTVTPAWHNKPYRHNMEVKVGEEITIQVEWLPHRSDT